MCDLNYAILVHTALLYIPLTLLFAFSMPGYGTEWILNIFPSIVPVFFVFCVCVCFLSETMHESSGPLSDSFECGSNHQALDSSNPLRLSGCVNIPWAAALTLWIDKHSFLENIIFNSGVGWQN